MSAHFARLSLAIVLCASISSAQIAAKPLASPAARSNMFVKMGGMIQSPISGPSILFLNTQKRVPAALLNETADEIQKLLHLPCVLNSKPATDPTADATKALADKNTAVVIVICDSASQPALLVAPESRWAIVNVAALNGFTVSSDKLAERTQKELWRALGYVMGAANSNFEHCLLKPVFSPADLDALTPKILCPEPFGKMLAQSQKMGLKPVRFSSYRKAVEEGWAPAPTNDIQRAIWQECHK